MPKQRHPSPAPAFHYGWVIVFTGTLCVFAGLGFGRFAIGMLLPAMGESLNLSYSQMGFISTCNFIGYLLAVLACGFLVTRFGTRRTIFAALLVVGISMALIGLAGGYMSVAILYMLTGMGSGASNVPIMALVASWFASRLRGKAAGFIVIGSGFAILLCGRLIPFVNRLGGTDGWRLSWQILGGIVVLIAFVCLLLLRDRPAEMGLAAAGAGNSEEEEKKSAYFAGAEISKKSALHLGIIYFLFGYTYVIYATFIVTVLVQERGFSEAAAGGFWSWIGLLSLFSGPVFGTLSDRLGRKAGLILVFSIQLLAYLFIALKLPAPFLYLSIGCYGIVAWSIPSIMAALVADYVGPAKAARLFGLITFIFAMGQISGPYVAGLLAEISGSFRSSFLMAAVGAGLAVLLSSRISKPAFFAE